MLAGGRAALCCVYRPDSRCGLWMEECLKASMATGQAMREVRRILAAFESSVEIGEAQDDEVGHCGSQRVCLNIRRTAPCTTDHAKTSHEAITVVCGQRDMLLPGRGTSASKREQRSRCSHGECEVEDVGAGAGDSEEFQAATFRNLVRRHPHSH